MVSHQLVILSLIFSLPHISYWEIQWVTNLMNFSCMFNQQSKAWQFHCHNFHTEEYKPLGSSMVLIWCFFSIEWFFTFNILIGVLLLGSTVQTKSPSWSLREHPQNFCSELCISWNLNSKMRVLHIQFVMYSCQTL